ncbi:MULTISPECIES: MFS transporter [unclassified Paenibacillus]|uniref:MFS transporter n=1 Tax=unclassified Paenibacillus TaxID=185978 RepID=UPI0008C907D8|nr:MULTISPECIES: MFS transporter [unclassified Paenibacillus]QLG40717.1 MFS transporter [Paenibacillus sp. E222]SEN59230.1 drug resistance transporter, EmrB/QacA subfamily [Paenibacillus sp. OK076]
MNARNIWLMISVGLGIMLNPLNSSMISIAIARLQQEFILDVTTVSWIIFSFYIASAVAQPVMGKCSDLFGRRKIFLIGLVVVFGSSMLAPLSPDFSWLIVFRIIQSVGTSMMVAVGMAIVRIHVTEKQAAALSILAMFLSGAAAVGPFIGGVLIHWWDWQSIFLVNIPLVIASFIFAWKTIPKEATLKSNYGDMSIRKWFLLIDAPGILLFTVALVTLLMSVLSVKSIGHLLTWHLMAGGIGLLALASFIRHELKTASPFIPLRVFAKYPEMTWVNVQFMLVNTLFYALFFGVPSYLQQVRHLNEVHTGLLMLTLGLCSLISSPLAGRWIDKSGTRPALIVSAVLMTCGSILIVALDKDSPVVNVILPLAVFGISNGLNSVGMQAALFKSTPKDMIGVASGIFNTSRYLGTILSSLLIGIVMGDTFSFIGFQTLGIILTVLAASLIIMTLRRQKSSATQTL